jgi:hypothetical protein
MKQKTTNI